MVINKQENMQMWTETKFIKMIQFITGDTHHHHIDLADLRSGHLPGHLIILRIVGI
jgi:hypothetical protein